MREPRGKNSVPPHEDVWQDASWRQRVRRRLMSWYRRNARELPWRNDPNPYRVWISEIMLQQTQVATVIPYYERFLASFPDVQTLAAADEQNLLGHWEGLGYYRRAKSMHKAAKQIVAQHHGRFPTTFDEVVALPGIGRYTAGAILSISHDQRLPILEGNTQRVFSRWVAVRGNPSDTSVSNLLWQIAATMLPRKHPGAFNQAAMELGALVCSPREPDCELCPVAGICSAQLGGLQDKIPGTVSRVAYQARTEFALLIADQQVGQPRRYLMRPLPEGRRWAGLWDFPRTTRRSVESVAAAARELSADLRNEIRPGVKITTIKHAVTKYRISLHVHAADLSGGKTQLPAPWRFVSVAEMEHLPMSVTGRRIAAILAAN